MYSLEAMMVLSRSLLVVMRVAMAFQVIVGIGFWTGHWSSLVNVHMVVGMLYVLAFWVIAGTAIAQRRATGLAVFAFVWGLVIAAFGMTQQQILPGDLHWIIRVLHLVIAVAALPIAERLAAGQTRTLAQAA
jgi:hypothetical protein